MIGNECVLKKGRVCKVDAVYRKSEMDSYCGIAEDSCYVHETLGFHFF